MPPVIDPERIPAQTVAGRLLRLPLRLVPRGLDVPILGGPNRGLRWRTGSSVHGCWLGTYERDKAELVARAAEPGMVAYDIGANAGYYTLLLSRRVGPSGKVIAFEALPGNVASLAHHVAVNRLANTQVIAAAVSDRVGLSGFRVGGSNAEGGLTDGVGDFAVPTLSLDHAVAALGLPRPDLVKMDVEGAEGLVLGGAEAVLRGGASTWFVSLHGEGPARRSRAAFAACGYRVRDLGGRDVDEREVGTLAEVQASRR